MGLASHVRAGAYCLARVEVLAKANVLFGFSVGVTQVEGVRCHHFAFVEQDIDWQIWIEDGTQWVPRKLVITYKTLPGAPQSTAVLSD